MACARRLALAVSALAGASAVAGCQVVFGLDGYTLGSGGGGGGSSSGTGGSSATGWQPTSCKPRLPELPNQGGTQFCRSRPLAALNTADGELFPSAYCAPSACYVYFERRVFTSNPPTDTLMCAVCNDIGNLDCDPPQKVISNVINPYFRAAQPEIWVAAIRSGSTNYDIHHATISGCSPLTLSDFVPLSGAVSSTANEFYPAISPDGRTLFFTRCPGGVCGIYVTHRASTTVDFPDGQLVAGLRAGAPPGSMDLHAQPVWVGAADEISALYFASTRAAATVGDPNQLDVFVATRALGAAWNAPFDPPTRVRAISGKGSDFAPVPILPQYALQARLEPGQESDLHLLDLGCVPNFDEPSDAAFTGVSLPTSDELAPAFVANSLYFARAESGSDMVIMESARSASGYDAATQPTQFALEHASGSTDRDPAPTLDGRLLFASDRGGNVSKLWIASSSGAPARATQGGETDEEATPFVDVQGALWFSLRRAMDDAPIIARATRQGDGWGAPSPVPGLAHQSGRADFAPRLTQDGLRLYFVSERDGGFAPATSCIWVATRSDPTADWDPTAIAAVPELCGVTGSRDAWPSQDGCKITLGADARQPGSDPWSWDLFDTSWTAK